MNKQEFQQKLKNMESVKDFTYTSAYDAHGKGFQEAKELALSYSESLDEPEKPVLSKEEAEWVEGLKEEQERRPFWTKYSLLYFITRCGFGYGFSYDRKDREIELKHYPHEIHAEKERLANAILYGYEVEKEKLYTARLKGIAKEKESYVYKIIESGEIYLSDLVFIEGKSQVYFTQTELENLKYWNNPAFEIVEVAE